MSLSWFAWATMDAEDLDVVEETNPVEEVPELKERQTDLLGEDEEDYYWNTWTLHFYTFYTLF